MSQELGTIALTGANGRNLCCDQNNACAFNRDWIQAWESFQVIGLEDGRVAFRSWNNLYLHAAADRYHVWFCSSTIGKDEMFDMEFTGSKMSIRTNFGKYLTCELDSSIPWLVCRATWNMAWEQFGVTVLSGSMHGLITYKSGLEEQKKRDEEIARLQEEHAAMERRLQQQMEAEREAHRIQREKQDAEARQRRHEDAEMRLQIVGQSLKQNDRETVATQARLQEEETKLEMINEKLLEETLARSRFDPPNPGDSIKVVLLGKTGDGKSTLGNRLLGDISRRGDTGTFATCERINSKTQEIQLAFAGAIGTRFCIVDTPGEDDSGGRDRIHRTNLVDFLHGIGEVHAFVFVWNFTNRRLGMQTKMMFREMTRILGTVWWRNCIIVMTHVDDEDDIAELARRERDLPNEIGDMFGLSYETVSQISVVGIGKHTFQAQCGQIFGVIMTCNRGVPFVSESLVAPVEERQGEFEEQSRECSRLQAKLAELTDEKERLVAQQTATAAVLSGMS